MDWNEVEKNIKSEIEFLKNNIDLSPFNHNDPIKCSECLFRLLAVLILAGKIKVRKISYHDDCLWAKEGLVLKENNDKNHGALWHSSKIKLIKQYFEEKEFKVIDELQLFYGRCDVGVPELKIFVEVGTINLYKLYINLINMSDGRILLVTNDSLALEFIF